MFCMLKNYVRIPLELKCLYGIGLTRFHTSTALINTRLLSFEFFVNMRSHLNFKAHHSTKSDSEESFCL